MCTICGCSNTNDHDEEQTSSHSKAHAHSHSHDHSHTHEHEHSHHHEHEHAHDHSYDDLHHYGKNPARAHVPGMDSKRLVEIEQNILGKNDQYAATNRARFTAAGMFAVNLVSSPGSGKTTLLTQTLSALKDELPMVVIEGDQETDQDARRIRETGVRAVQINTGKGCHLDAHQVGHAVDHLAPEAGSVVMIENVGNLVCPAAFDLGESARVAILSVTEGEDKPIKYPDIFHNADLLLINKIDLLPYLQFDLQRCLEYADKVNPGVPVIQVSATRGEGMQDWFRWLRLQVELRNIGRNTGTQAVAGAE